MAEDMKPKFEYTTFIATPASKVWEAITQKDVVDKYYLAPIHTLELKEGGKISYGVEEEMISGKITKLEKGKALTHTFKFGEKGPSTNVTYSVQAVGEKMSVLTVVHTGFDSEDQTYADISGGWPVILSSLKTLLETGKVMPWPQPVSQ